MNTLRSYYSNRVVPTADVEKWLQLVKAPAAYRDVYIAVDPYRDSAGEWELCESLLATSGFCQTPSENFFLSMLVHSDAMRPTEFDLGFGKFSRPNAPGTFILGDDVMIPRIQGNGPFHSIALYFNREAMLNRLRGMLDGREPDLQPLHANAFRDDGMEILLKQLLNEGCRSFSSSRVLQEELVDRILQRMLIAGENEIPTVSENDRLKKASIGRVLEYIHGNIHLDPGLDELSRVAGVTRAHFGRLFRQTIGISPLQYIIRLRVQKAKQLLREKSSDVQINQIASLCGYYDRSHMHHEFVRHVGVTPDVFRRYS